jgi:hypothetical protein
MAHLLGSHMEFIRLSKQRIIRHIFLRIDPLNHCIFTKSKSIKIQGAIIIILYLFDAECKTAIKNIIPNAKSIINPQTDKI